MDTVSSYSSLSSVLNVAIPHRALETQKKLLLSRSTLPDLTLLCGCCRRFPGARRARYFVVLCSELAGQSGIMFKVSEEEFEEGHQAGVLQRCSKVG